MKQDALVIELNRLGYQAAWLPQSGLTPPDVYELVRANGIARLARRGPLHHFLPATLMLLPTSGMSADIEHRESTKKDLRGATDFLKRALGYLGVSEIPKLDLGFLGGKDVTFAFSGVTYQRVDVAAIDPLLQEIQVHAIPSEQVERGRVHIAFEYLYASCLQLRRADHSAFAVKLEGRIGDFIDIGSAANIANANDTTLSFANVGTPAAFAYRAARLILENGRWQLSLEAASRDGSGATQPFLPCPAVVLESE